MSLEELFVDEDRRYVGMHVTSEALRSFECTEHFRPVEVIGDVYSG